MAKSAHDLRILARGDSKPSEVTEIPWLITRRQKGDYPDYTDRGGKWLIFVPIDQIDDVWIRIKQATGEGLLGNASKVATAMPSPFAKNPDEKVICVYTYDSDDYEDVHRIREELRRLGFEQTLCYKTDEATLKGQYSHRGDTDICKYRE